MYLRLFTIYASKFIIHFNDYSIVTTNTNSIDINSFQVILYYQWI